MIRKLVCGHGHVYECEGLTMDFVMQNKKNVVMRLQMEMNNVMMEIKQMEMVVRNFVQLNLLVL